MWQQIELVAGMLVVTAIAYFRLNSGRFFLVLDAHVLFLTVAITIGFTVGESLGGFMGWVSAITYLVLNGLTLFVLFKRNQKAERKRALSSWAKGGPYP